MALKLVDILLGLYLGDARARATGVLIDEYTVLTAGHLTEGADGARVWFDADVEENPEYPFSGVTSIEGTPYTHPNYVPSGGPGLSDYNWVDVGIVIPMNL